MYEEDLIFGPLTLRQGIILSVGSVVAYLALTKDVEYTWTTTAIVIVITISLLARFKPKKIGSDPEDYFRKKIATDPKAARNMMSKKIAEVSSQIHERESKGLRADPVLEQTQTDLVRIKEELRL